MNPSTILYQSRWFSICSDAAGGEYLTSRGDEVMVVPLTDRGEVKSAIQSRTDSDKEA